MPSIFIRTPDAPITHRDRNNPFSPSSLLRYSITAEQSFFLNPVLLPSPGTFDAADGCITLVGTRRTHPGWFWVTVLHQQENCPRGDAIPFQRLVLSQLPTFVSEVHLPGGDSLLHQVKTDLLHRVVWLHLDQDQLLTIRVQHPDLCLGPVREQLQHCVHSSPVLLNPATASSMQVSVLARGTMCGSVLLQRCRPRGLIVSL